MNTLYDSIGVNYPELRRPDARLETEIKDALGSARTVLNVGAGTGSYEPTDRSVTAVEPSIKMIRQRSASAAPVVRSFVENMPFNDKSFDASMAVLTVHHWTDKQRGFKEMRRVTRGPVVVFTFDPSHSGTWLNDYIPELATLDEGQMPRMTDYEVWLGTADIKTVPIPHDCTDGFLHAYWRRPAAYLDPRVRAAISSFWALGDVSPALKMLENDLQSGAWHERYSKILDLDEYDAGYRLVVTRQ